MSDEMQTTRENALEEMFDQPLTRPETDHGIGPTLGGDVAMEDAREERRSFAPADEQVLRGARSA